MNIHLIWAQDQNGAIGKNGKLPWCIPADLKNFKKLTLDSTIIMGRKTWDSLPVKPLPKRRNIVLSSNKIANIECYQSIDDCITQLENDRINDLYVIGGSSIYNYFLQYAMYLHITLINDYIENVDTFFPKPLKELKESFIKEKEINLSNKATYTRWVKDSNQ